MWYMWYVVWCGSKNEYQRDMCLKEIGVHAKNTVSILSSTITNWGHIYDQLMSMRSFILKLIDILIQALRIKRKVAMASIWVC